MIPDVVIAPTIGMGKEVVPGNDRSVSLSSSSSREDDRSPVGGSALQCAAHAPHSPSHPSPTGDLTGKTLALLRPAPATMRETTYKE